MRPLRVTAVMADGRVASIDGRLFLDSIMAYSWMLENHPEQVTLNNAATDKAIDIDLSCALEKRGEGEDWFWACSMGQFEEKCETIEYAHKRVSPMAAERYVDFGKRRGKIVTGGGPYKSWRKPILVKLIPSVTWYCVGSAAEIKRLLESITHIGGRRGSGYGLVREWRVEAWDQDWSIYGPNGELMRPIPDPEGTEEQGIRPPYWSPRNWRVCRVPEVEAIGRMEAGAV